VLCGSGLQSSLESYGDFIGFVCRELQLERRSHREIIVDEGIQPEGAPGNKLNLPKIGVDARLGTLRSVLVVRVVEYHLARSTIFAVLRDIIHSSRSLRRGCLVTMRLRPVRPIFKHPYSPSPTFPKAYIDILGRDVHNDNCASSGVRDGGR